MREVGRDLWAWLSEGAHIYVCGDALRMAKDVERALIDVVAKHGERSAGRRRALRRRTEEAWPLSDRRVLERPLMSDESRAPSETRPARMAPLARLPVFLALDGKRAVLAGGSAGGGLEGGTVVGVPARRSRSMPRTFPTRCWRSPGPAARHDRAPSPRVERWTI